MTHRRSARQARLAWWLLVAPMAAAGLLAGAASAVTLAVRFDLPSADRLVDACRSLIPQIAAERAVELIVAGLGLAVTVRLAFSARHELRALRRYHQNVSTSRHDRIGATDVWIVEDDRLLAFTGGWFRPRIHLSTAALDRLNDEELAAVVAHEDRHRRHRDPIRHAAARAAVGALPFLPTLDAQARRYASTLELAADERAAYEAGEKALAGALLRLGTTDDDPHGGTCRIAPERVDQLAGRPTPPLPLRNAFVLSLGALALGVVSLESIESARSAPIDIVLVAAQLCTVGGIVTALGLLVLTLRRDVGTPARTRSFAASPKG